MQETKRCSKCRNVKPVSEFAKNKNWNDGFFPQCRECKRAGDRASHAKHKAARSVARKASYQANPEPKKGRAKAQYYKDTAAKKQYARAWQAANPDKKRRYNAVWVQRNLHGAVRENVRRRYARRKGAKTVVFTKEQLAQRMAYWGNRCWVCEGPFDSVDHVKPLNKGGAHMLCNLRPICRVCNSRKRDTWPLTE